MAIRTQNGRVLTSGGRVSCACCDDEIVINLGDFTFAEPEDCDCETVECYNATTNPSPLELTYGNGLFYPNRTPGTDRVTLGGALGFQSPALIQYPIVKPLGGGSFTITGWINKVSSPTIVRLTGQVGGDIALYSLANVGSPPEYDAAWLAEYGIDGLIPNDGEFPCGVCPTDRNGPHNISPITFVLFPFTYVWIQAISYFPCVPWFNLQLRRVSALPP